MIATTERPVSSFLENAVDGGHRRLSTMVTHRTRSHRITDLPKLTDESTKSAFILPASRRICGSAQQESILYFIPNVDTLARLDALETPKRARCFYWKEI
jgi:hypothetical protein